MDERIKWGLVDLVSMIQRNLDDETKRMAAIDSGLPPYNHATQRLESLLAVNNRLLTLHLELALALVPAQLLSVENLQAVANRAKGAW
jgi:hypothetical protein